MSRLYDRLWRFGLHSKEVEGGGKPQLGQMLEAIQGATVVDLSPAARYFLVDTEQEVWDCVDDFPAVSLPLSPAFYEFQAPPYTRSKEQGVTPYPFNSVGYFCQMGKFGEMERALVEDMGASWWLGLDPKWLVECTTFAELHKGMSIAMLMTQYWVLDDSGGMLKNADGEVAMGSVFYAGRNTGSEYREELQSELGSLKFPLLFGLSFMHCKNVSVSQVSPPPKASAKHERKHGKPLTRYYTLEIEPMKRVLKKEGGSDEVGLKRAMHICRGHFATYSDAKPLFGKYSGTFWKPQHIKGSRERGEIVKDYAVKRT